MRDGVGFEKENAVANDTKSATTWHAVRDSTCAAAQATSGCKAPPAPCQEPSGSIPDQTQKEIPRHSGVFLFGGDGGNRTPVRKRFLRNFSGRRRLFAFPYPCASRHARGLGSFMMHGTLKALRTHGPHSSTPLSGPWASRKRRSRDYAARRTVLSLFFDL